MNGWFAQDFKFWKAFVEKLSDSSVKYLLMSFGACLIALALTPVFRSLAKKLGMVDKPDPRRINKVPIPRGGGAAIVIAVNLMFWLYAALTGFKGLGGVFDMAWLRVYTLGSLILGVVGFLDDRRGLPALVKMGGQLLVASLFFFSGVRWGHVFLRFPVWFDYFFTVFWIVGAINAFNLIDGLDGLASGLALIASLGLAGSLFFQNRIIETLPYLTFAGACLGFLRYNFNPATVFLGDTGSMFLGMSLATLPLMSGSRSELIVSIGMPLLVMGVPIFDTFLAIWRRTVRAFLPNEVKDAAADQGGGVVMQPDKDHLHHRLLRLAQNNQRVVVYILYAVTAFLVLVGIGATFLQDRSPGLFLVAFVALGYVVVRHFDCVEVWDTGRLLSKVSQDRSTRFAIPLSILVDILLLNAIWLFTWYFQFDRLPKRTNILAALPVFTVPILVSMVLCKIYNRVWARSRVRDFIVLCFAVFLGSCVAVGCFAVFNQKQPSMIRFTVVYTFFAALALAAVRVWRESMIGVLGLLSRHVLLDKPDTKRVLVYGGGMTLRSFLRERIERDPNLDRIILGVLDDDPGLRGRMVAGFEVFGSGDDLERVVAEHRIHAVVITCVMTPERLAEIVDRFKKVGVKVTIWRSEEAEL